MANISGASLAQIQQRLRDTPAYHPFDADTFCDWAMEAGDIVTVRRGEESYQSPIHSSHLVWRGKQNMELNASGTKERDAIARVSKQKYARGGYGMRQQKSLYYEFYSEDGYLHSQFELNESHMRSEFEDVANSLRGEFEVTASHLRTEFNDTANSLRGEFEVTASHLRGEFEDAANGLRGEFEVTASHLRSEFNDTANSLRGEFEVTASGLRSEFEDVANSLRGEFEVTASGLRADFEDANNSLRGEFEVTAASLRAQFEDTSNSLRSSIEAEAGRIGLVVEGYGADASVKRASIVLAINNGKSSTHIDADEVYIGDKSSTTVINGKLNASDLTADFIAGKLATLSSLQVNGISASGSVSFSGTTTLSGSVQIQGSDGTTRNLATGIRTLYKASESEGVVTLQYIDFNGATHDVTFNKAVATISGSWSDGTLTVSKDPNGSSTYSSVIDSVLANGQVTYANQILTVPVTVRVRNNGGSQSETGYSGTLAVGAGLAYTAGQNSVNASKLSWSAGSLTIKPSAGTGSSATVNLTAASATWDGNTASIKIWDGTSADSQHGSDTGYTVTVDASGRYTAGQNSVNVKRGTWNAGSLTIKPSAGTGSSVTVNLTAASATWDENTASVKIWDGTGADAQHGSDTGYTVTVDATARYKAGKKDASVTGAWEQSNPQSSANPYNKYTVRNPSNGNAVMLSETVNVSQSYDSTTHKYTATVDATHSSSVITAVTGTEAYIAGWSAAYDKVSMPGAGTGTTFDVQVPPSAVDGNAEKKTFTISKGTPGTSGYAAVSLSGTVVGRIDISDWYTTGKTDGYNSAHVTGSWSNNVFTYSKTNDSTKPNSASVTIGTRFNSASTGYYMSAYRTVGGNTSDIANTSTYYNLGTNSAGTVVQVQDRNGNQISNTPIYNLPTIGISSSSQTINAGKSVTVYATKNGSNVASAACTVTARSIGYITVDAGGNHNGDWWNFRCYTQKGGTLVCEGNTDVANYGMYVPGSSSSSSHTITSFNTGSPSGQSYNSIVNGNEGYMLVGSGNDATAYIVTKSTWNCDGNSKSGVSYLQSAPTLLYKKGYADGGGGGGGTHTPSLESWDRSDWSVDVNGNIPSGYIKIAETSRHSAGYVFKFKILVTADCQGVKQSGSKGYYIVLT